MGARVATVLGSIGRFGFVRGRWLEAVLAKEPRLWESARRDGGRAFGDARTSGVREPPRHWTEVVAGSASETRSGSNRGHGGAVASGVGEARCGGVGMDRPQYPRRRDRGYSVCLVVLGGA